MLMKFFDDFHLLLGIQFSLAVPSSVRSFRLIIPLSGSTGKFRMVSGEAGSRGY